MATVAIPVSGQRGLQPLEEQIRDLFILNYATFAACAWLVYDHLLTANLEWQLVWRAPKSIPKWGFLVYRYMSFTVLLLLAYVTSGFARGLSDAACGRIIPALSILGVIYVVFSDALAVLYVAALWKRNSSVFRILIVSFVVTTCGSIISIGISMSMSVPTLRYYPPLNVCISLKKPALLAFPWACGLAFDFITLGFILWNAFDRPRSTPLRSTLRGDGIAYFMIVTGIRLVSLIITLVAPLLAFSIMTVGSWSCFTINLTHFIFRQRNRNARTTKESDSEGTAPASNVDCEMELDAYSSEAHQD